MIVPGAQEEADMSRFSTSAVLVLAGLLISRPAAADVELEAKGPVAFLHSDRLLPGDEDTFAQFLAQPRSEPIRIVYLDSRGGNTQTAIAIGRSIRAHGIDTAFHVGRGRCVSACTTVFLGGVERYYIGSEGVQDGVATRLGLGFHPSTGGSRGEELIGDYYREMGVEGANKFRYDVYSRASVMEPTGGRNGYQVFFAGGRSAMAAGVATSTAEPDEPRLRD